MAVESALELQKRALWFIYFTFLLLQTRGSKLCQSLVAVLKEKKRKNILTICSLWLLKIRKRPQSERSQVFITPTDNTLTKQTRILSKCPWTELRTPACSLAASHSEFERQLNTLNANAYHFSLKSDSAKMTKLHCTVLWQHFLEPIIYVFMTRSCWIGLFSPHKHWISTWHSIFFFFFL